MSLVRKRFGTNSFYNRTFSERVVILAKAVPPGFVVTYGDVARAAGGGGMAAQSITTILSKAYTAGETEIPFHRIVYANGRVWLDDVHRAERQARYLAEGIQLDVRDRVYDFEAKRFDLGAYIKSSQKS